MFANFTERLVMLMISKFNGTSAPKGSYSAKRGVKHYEFKSPLEKNIMVK